MIHIFKKNLLIIWLFLPFFTLAQQLGENAKTVSKESKWQKPDHRWQFSLEGAPQFTGVYDLGGATSLGKTGCNLGLKSEFYLLKQFSVSLGAYYDRRKFGFEYFTPYLVFQDTLISYLSHAESKIDYHVNYLTFPLGFQYYVGENKLRFYIKGSVYYSFFLSARKKGYSNLYIHADDIQYVDQEEYPNIHEGDNRKLYDDKTEFFFIGEKFSSFDVGVAFGLGLDYALFERIHLFFAPEFTTSFGRLLDNPVYKSTKWSKNIKLETGISYLIKK